MRLLVCPFASLDRALADGGPAHVVTIASPERPAPSLGRRVAHLHLSFHDVAEPSVGRKAACAEDVAALLAFAEPAIAAGAMAVACELGVSRSPAAAFAIACQARPDLRPAAIARALRAASPQATPNPLLVALADARLGRGGRMSSAVATIGRGRDYDGPEPFLLDLGALVPVAAA